MTTYIIFGVLAVLVALFIWTAVSAVRNGIKLSNKYQTWLNK